MKSAIVLCALFCLGLTIPLGLKPLEEERWLQICCVENDKNDDGAISFREFSPFVLAVLDLNRKELERIFLTADEDKNSDLDGSECPVVRRILRETMANRVEEYKAKYDVDVDGNINQDEVRNLALNEFGVSAQDADLIFNRSHHSSGSVNHSEWVELLLELRAKAVKEMGVRFSKWATVNKKGYLSYGELKKFDPAVDVPTLKKNFKKIDYDKDLFISPVEYMALVRELREETSHSMSSVHTVEPSKQMPENTSVATTKSIARRAALETAPPVNETEAKNALRNSDGRKSSHSGGRRVPTVDFDAPTVPFDDPDFE
ncbi:unnamed protein product [Auanema sp. JU1783]|nr:unnamed protein product [Auanema sp. JU1783]